MLVKLTLCIIATKYYFTIAPFYRPTTGGGSEMIVSDDRVFAQGNFLIIFETIAGDQGVYTCNAVNAAGSASASTMLVIFGLVNVVTVEVAEFSNPNMENTCHELNTTEFEVCVCVCKFFLCVLYHVYICVCNPCIHFSC